jgi:hypothetical protein
MATTHSPVRWILGLFQGKKELRRGVNHPLPSSAQVKEKVELYLYLPSGDLWSILSQSLPFLFFILFVTQAVKKVKVKVKVKQSQYSPVQTLRFPGG